MLISVKVRYHRAGLPSEVHPAEPGRGCEDREAVPRYQTQPGLLAAVNTV